MCALMALARLGWVVYSSINVSRGRGQGARCHGPTTGPLGPAKMAEKVE